MPPQHHATRPRLVALRRLRRLAGLDAGSVWMPGCLEAPTGSLERVDWRFCGGFFAGGDWAMLDLCQRHVRLVRELLPRRTWEVNAWALLERSEIRGDQFDRLFAEG